MRRAWPLVFGAVFLQCTTPPESGGTGGDGAGGEGTADGPACSEDTDCPGNLVCTAEFTGGTGSCAPPCSSDADCAGTGVCLDASPGYGVCSLADPCDPLTNAGCEAAGTCQLVEGSHLTATCLSSGTLGAVSLQTQYASGGTPVSGSGDLPVCRIGQTGGCPAGSECLPIEGATGPLAAVYGACRTTCDPWDPNACASVNTPDSPVACMVDTQPGQAPVSFCGWLYDDCGSTEGPDGAACVGFGGCTSGCATSSDCPPWANCANGACVADALPCDPFDPGSTCPSGQSCTVTPDGQGGGTFACAPAGTATWPQQCKTDGDCAPGDACARAVDSTDGVCEAYCELGSGGGSACGGAEECVSVAPAVTVPIPSMAPPYDEDVFGTCRVACDPADPGKACLATMTCVPFVDPSGTDRTDCQTPTGNGTGPGACATDPLACAPGYGCRASDGACVKWCYVGVPSSCPDGTTCTPASPPLSLGGIEYGTCG